MFDQNCIFCKIAQEIIPSKKYFENNDFIAFFDINPIANNHLVCISKNHYKNNNEMSNQEWESFMEIVRTIAEKLIKENNADGYNLLINQGEAAESAIAHRPHCHIIPRYFNDNIKIDPRN
jgi:histidine triad (HIT) family protein